MIQETIEIGPIHEWLPGPMKLSLGMSGDRIVRVDTRFGYASRDIERQAIGLNHRQAQLTVGRVEPESALLLDRVFSEAVEKISGFESGERVNWIRDITSSLSELNFQLKYLANMSRRLGIKILFHSILKHRESLLDLLELLSGSRYGYYFLIPGGARYDITEGFQERLDAWSRNFVEDYPRIEALFRWTHVFQNRMRNLGQVLDRGEYGFVSEASIESTRYGFVSHVESRLIYSLENCKSIAAGLRDLLNLRPAGAHLSPFPVRGGQAFHERETLRGAWGMDLALDDAGDVTRLRLTSPSSSIVGAIGPALEGESLEDLAVVLESLSFSIPEIDR
jgi:NADH:ubiquinone oxidoreductase subunit D